MRRASWFGLLVMVAAMLVTGTYASAAPRRVSACPFTATTDVVVTADITCSPGSSGIVVAANGITIDLHGHTITGDRTNLHRGIDDSAGFDKITVKNGTLTKFAVGIDATNASNNVQILHVTTSGNVNDGVDLNGNSPRLIAVSAVGNGGDGFDVDASSTRLVLKNSTASGNSFTGYDLTGSFRIARSEASGNGSDGMNLLSFGSSIIRRSTLLGNGGIGLTVDGDGVRIVASRADGNAGGGIFVDGDAAKIGRVRGGARSDPNHADGNGFVGGASDGSGLGISVTFSSPAAAPVGRNEASGNDGAAECDPSNLC